MGIMSAVIATEADVSQCDIAYVMKKAFDTDWMIDNDLRTDLSVRCAVHCHGPRCGCLPLRAHGISKLLIVYVPDSSEQQLPIAGSYQADCILSFAMAIDTKRDS